MKKKTQKPRKTENEWNLYRRYDGRVEAICPHGIGHHKGIHGCDGCCKSCPSDLWKSVTEDK